MPNDTSAFTLSLFDNTALSSWSHHALQDAADPNEGDQADSDDTADDGSDAPPPALVAVGTRWLLRIPPLLASAMTWAGLAAIGVAAATFTATTPYPGSLVAVPVVGTALLLSHPKMTCVALNEV